MALINCPDCNTTVSDRADKCPNCHCPIAVNTPQLNENIKVIEKNSEGCFLQTLNIGCIFILVIIVIIFIGSLLTAL